MRKITILALTLAFAFTMSAQIQTPPPSPSSKLEQTVGLATITVEYSRPSLKERVAFGTADQKSMEKYDAPWRTGANVATKITFSEDLKINGENLKGGAYAILTKPGMKEWTVMLFPYDKGSWTSYTDKTPALETKVMVQKSGRQVETFTIDINNLRNESASIDLIWDDFVVSIPITLGTDAAVMKSITAVMNGPSQSDYYQAASYYHDADKDLAQALVWIKKANATDEKFWMVRREALILADMGRYEDAIAAAKTSKSLAEQADYEPYIRNNEESIKEWMALLPKDNSMRGKIKKQAVSKKVQKAKVQENQ
ncbi:MAG: DUF2911 domain-containing protein [Bacteroidota bacterium]